MLEILVKSPEILKFLSHIFYINFVQSFLVIYHMQLYTCYNIGSSCYIRIACFSGFPQFVNFFYVMEQKTKLPTTYILIAVIVTISVHSLLFYHAIGFNSGLMHIAAIFALIHHAYT